MAQGGSSSSNGLLWKRGIDMYMEGNRVILSPGREEDIYQLNWQVHGLGPRLVVPFDGAKAVD